MALKLTHPLSIIILSLFVAGSIASPTSGGQKHLRLGGARPITDPNDPKVLEAAAYAVARHNKLANTNLRLQSVINGTVLVVGGTLYKLVISAVDGNHINASQGHYVVKVYDKPWQHLKILVSFEKV